VTGGGWDAEVDRRRALLRQLRDLDDDLAAGKLTEADHSRLREPLEREAAAALAASRNEGTAAARRNSATARRGPRSRRARVLVPAIVAVAAVAGVAALLAGAVTPRGTGQTVSGSGPAAVATAPPAGPAGGSAAAPAGPSASAPSLTAEQAAAIDAAALDVKAHPKDVAKHITLAHAYADGGATQLAAVEYLAILKLDPVNAEANTALALLAFEVGQPRQAKSMLDKVLGADPAYPEALYVRGLVLLSGLHQPAAAKRDLHAYLAAAPYGSHRTAAETLLALADSQK
jgi:cytochrome c-type biogenesis protein CcmH/NrfG